MIEEVITKDDKVSLIRRTKDHFELFRNWYVNKGEWHQYDAPWETRNNTDELNEKYLKSIEMEKAGKYRGLLIKDTDGYLGWVSVYGYPAHPDSKYVGIDICENERLNKGIGTHALKLWITYVFSAYQCHRVGLVTWSFNARMIHVARKIGFIEEGKEREVHHWNGEWIDRYHFGVLKEEWEH